MGFQAESLCCWAKMAVGSMPQWFSIENLCWWRCRRRTSSHRSTPDFELGNAGQDLENAVTNQSANHPKSKWEDTQAENNSLTAAITVVKTKTIREV